MSLATNKLTIPAINGTELRSGNALAFQHHIAVDTDIAATGNLEIKARPPGTIVFEIIEGAEAIDLSSPVSVQVTGVIEEYELTLTSVTGATEVYVTDTCEVV